jgi:thiol-disulfide isomerase/thioredoxin
VEVTHVKKNAAVLLLVLMLAGFAIYQNIQAKHKETILPTEEAPKASFLAPSFTLTGLDGSTYTVGGAREKPLFVNFWASWCGPCEEEAPDLVNLYNKYKGQFDLYAVNVTQGDKLENVKAFVKEHEFPFPVLLDKEGKVAEMYRFLVIPTSFIVDKNGVIQEVFNVLPPKELEKKLKKAINS